MKKILMTKSQNIIVYSNSTYFFRQISVPIHTSVIVVGNGFANMTSQDERYHTRNDDFHGMIYDTTIYSLY